MRRRDFLALGGAAAAFPRIALAQVQASRPAGRPTMIAALITQTKAQSDLDSLGPLLKGLAALGYVEGRDYRLEARYTDGDRTREAGLAADIVALAPDLIIASGASSELGELTKTIPIVAYFGGGADLLALDRLVGSAAKPRGNVTGIIGNSASLTGKHCDLAFEIIPTASRIGDLAASLSPDGGRGTREAIAAAAMVRKFTPVIVDVAQPADISPAFRALVEQRVDVAVVGSGLVLGDRSLAVRAAADARLPAIYNEQGYVEVGGLISYGFDRKATFTRLASFADLLLKGARVPEIPLEATSNFNTALNLKTAKSLGLAIPPTVLFRADLVIE